MFILSSHSCLRFFSRRIAAKKVSLVNKTLSVIIFVFKRKSACKYTLFFCNLQTFPDFFLPSLYEQILLRHICHELLAELLKECHGVVAEAVTLPGGGVGDENPALTIGVLQDNGGGAGKRTGTNPRTIALWGVVPTDGILMVGLLGGHELDALLAENVLDMRHTVDAGDETAQLGC